MNQWYYARDGQQAGPVSTDRLQQMLASGEVRRSDPVWRDGMSEWAPAETMAELWAAPQVTAPAVPPPPSPQLFAPLAGAAPLSAAQYYDSSFAIDSRPQSGLGIASFGIGLVALLIEIVFIVIATAAEMNRSSLPSAGRTSPAGGLTMVAGLGICGGVLLCIVGLIIGIISLNQPNKRLFGIMGTIINGGMILLVGALMVIGLCAR